MSAAASTPSPASLHLRPAAADQPHEAKPRLIWLLHFHKAAGTSFTTLAGQNGETKRMRNVAGGMDDPHSHLELDRASGLRWPLIVALSRRPPPRGCTNEVGLARSVLPQEIGRLVAANVTFVSTEHWFPDLAAAPLPRLVKLVVVFRDPMQRLLSSYLYHGCGDNRCPATARCRLSTWARAEANLYVRMLNGDPFGPVWMPRQCTQGYARRPVGQRALDAAARALARFDVVVTLFFFSLLLLLLLLFAHQVRPSAHTRPAERAKPRRRVRAPAGAWLAPHADAAGQRASCGETALPGCA